MSWGGGSQEAPAALTKPCQCPRLVEHSPEAPGAARTRTATVLLAGSGAASQPGGTPWAGCVPGRAGSRGLVLGPRDGAARPGAVGPALSLPHCPLLLPCPVPLDITWIGQQRDIWPCYAWLGWPVPAGHSPKPSRTPGGTQRSPPPPPALRPDGLDEGTVCPGSAGKGRDGAAGLAAGCAGTTH